MADVRGAAVSAQPVRADARRLPLADESVDLIITSPPYFALRSYRDGGDHYDGQVGSEPTPQAFLEALWEVTKECWRVLKPTGSLFVNLGDKRSGSGGGNQNGLQSGYKGGGLNGFADGLAKFNAPKRYNQAAFGRPKSKMLLPHRFAIGCEDGLADPDGIGWIVRQDIVWSKPNGLPESVTDRVRDSHEYWFHLVKQGRYFSAVDEVREPHIAPAHAPGNRKWASERQDGDRMETVWEHHALGKLPGSVWTVASEPLTIPEAVKAHYDLPDHFAAFPQEFPRRLILGWSPSGVCVACGEGRRPVVVAGGETPRQKLAHRGEANHYKVNGQGLDYAGGHGDNQRPRTITGYACACPDTSAPTRKSVVVDVFGGTGTVAGVARQLGRLGLSFDLSWDYGRLAKWFFTDGRRFAKTSSRTDKERQGDLFALQTGQGTGGVPPQDRQAERPSVPVPCVPTHEAMSGLWHPDLTQRDLLCEMSGEGRAEPDLWEAATAACEGRGIEGTEGRAGPEAGNEQAEVSEGGPGPGEPSLLEAVNVRTVRPGEAVGLAPHRRGPDEQRAVEPRRVVPALSPDHGRSA